MAGGMHGRQDEGGRKVLVF